MKSAISRSFPGDARLQHLRRKSAATESKEQLVGAAPGSPLTVRSEVSQLASLGKKSQVVRCPYCKQTAATRVISSDSRSTKKVNTMLWIGFADPLALSSFDWCQNIDHHCSRCGGHLVSKPFKGPMQVIGEDGTAELPLGRHHERTELPAGTNLVAELQGDENTRLQRGKGREAVGPGSLGPTQSDGSRVLGPAELHAEAYQPSVSSEEQAADMTDATHRELMRLRVPTGLPGEQPRLSQESKGEHRIKRKPVELGSGSMRVRATELFG